MLSQRSFFFAFCLVLMVQFDPVTYSVTQGEQAFIIAVLNFAADRDVTVDFATSDGSAEGDFVD